ncbi:MAG: class I SAM-dependent methyltransferase [Chthoniobacterales bacterium]
MSLDSGQRAAREQFDRQSARYGRTHVLADVSDLEAAVAGLDFPGGSGRRALDVATGGGHAALWLARRGFDLVLADVSERMLENASGLLREEGFKCETQAHPAEELPDSEESFDVVSCRVAAHHFSDPGAFVREVGRVLKPGGWLIAIDGTVPDGDPVAANWAHEVEKLRDPSHGRLIPPVEWRGFCDAAGLAVERCEVGRLKQPDLEWYFETAATSEANRVAVRELVRTVPDAAREAFEVAAEDGKVVWLWHRLHLVARKG